MSKDSEEFVDLVSLKRYMVKDVILAVENRLEEGDEGPFRIVLPFEWAAKVVTDYPLIQRMSILERILDIEFVQELCFRKGFTGEPDGSSDVIAEQI
jgi:hypothetical protein